MSVVRMKEITKEDWDRVLDENNPNFEEDFNELVARYFIRSKAEIRKEKLTERLKKSANLAILKDIITRDNWILDLEIHGETYMDRETLAVKKYEEVLICLENIGMVSEYFDYYGKGDEQRERLLELYVRLYQEQKKRKTYNPFNLRINKIPHSITKKLKELENERDKSF